jgi:hypothetical protein
MLPAVDGPRRVYFSLLLSYLAAFVLPLILGCAGFVFFIHVLDKQVKETNRLAVHQLRAVTDASLATVQSAAKILQLSQELDRLYRAAPPLSIEHLISCWNLQREMNL